MKAKGNPRGEVAKETIDREVQTEEVNKCNCEEEYEQSDVIIKENKIICVLKQAKCSEAEWIEYKGKVESEMDLKDLLEDLGKMIEAANRLSEKSKVQPIINDNINEKVAKSKTIKESTEREINTESGSPPIQNTKVGSMQKESCDGAVKEGWIYCDICKYKCKK